MNDRVIRALAAAVVGVTAIFGTAAIAATAIPDATALDKETVSEADFQRQLDQFEFASRIGVNREIPPGQRLLFDYGGYLSSNYLSVDDPAHNTHILRDEELVGYADMNLDNVQELFVRGHIGYRDYGQGDQFGGGIEEGGQHAAIDQLFYKFDLQKYLGAYKGVATADDVSLEGGRQTVVWANGLVLDQNIDGGTFNIIKGIFNLQGVAGITVPDTIDFDTSRPGFNDRTERGFFGLMLTTQLGQHRPFLYFLSQRDFNSDHSLRSATIATQFDYNSMYIGAGSTGSLSDRLAYSSENVFETDRGLSNSFLPEPPVGGIAPTQVQQQYQTIEAFAADERLDYLFADSHNSRATAEVILASGDHDRSSTNNTFGGNRIGTNDLAFNGFGLLNTGLSFAPQVSNVLIEHAGFTTQPFNGFAAFRKLEFGTDVFVYEKYLEQAPIDEPSDSGRYLGWEPDLFMNWQITSDLSLAMRYGLFFPGESTIGKAEPGSNSSRQLFFTGVTLAF